MRITFWGAARTVTGSAHLLELDKRRLMFDCGMFQGRRQLARELNTQYPVTPADVHEVILSHAHIDHSGTLPAFSRLGFKGPVHCTHATRDLAEILLRDSGHIQEKDAEFVTRRNLRRGEPPVEPLYTSQDVEQVLPRLAPKPCHREFEALGGRARFVFRNAGHILGAAFAELAWDNGAGERRLVYSGDVGRHNMPILKDPDDPQPADYLILESTYGNREHEEMVGILDRFAEGLQRIIGRGGRVIIPAFSVGRTQEVVYALNLLWNQGRLPKIPVFVDSPLSTNATEIFRRHLPLLNDSIQKLLETDPDPFGFDSLTYVRDVQTSKMINSIKTPVIIISASGMAEAGRVLHHLANGISDPRNAVLIVGFMAENTLGRRLVDKMPEVRIHGEMHPVRAEIIKANGLSAHGDRNDLRRFAKSVAAGGRLKKIFLVHGEESAMASLADALRQDLPGVDVVLPLRGQSFAL